MNEVLAVLLVTVAGAFLVFACSKGLSSRERRWVTASFLMHIGFACSQVPITLNFYGSSDMFLYFSYGEILAELMERDPMHVIPEVTALLLHGRPRLPIDIIGAGTSTGAMSALAAWTFYLLGPSKYGACIAFAMLSLTGKIAMYRVFVTNLGPEARLPSAIATLFLPSFVFWSSGLIKEAIVVGGLGWSLFGLHLWIRKGRVVAGWAIMMAAAIPISFIKAYILFPFVIAGGSWYYWARSMKRGRFRIRPAYIVAGGALAFGGIVVLCHYFPEYAFDTFIERTAQLQQVGQVVRGGSTYALSEEARASLAGQFAYAPLAFLTALFRPVLFEVHNLLMLANAIETTTLLILVVRIPLVRSLGSVRRQIVSEPFLVFCSVFVAALALAVGLASTNLGTLSRYRSPLLPFFVVLLVALGKFGREDASAIGKHPHSEGSLDPAQAIARSP